LSSTDGRSDYLENIEEEHRFSQSLNRLYEILFAEPDLASVLDCAVSEGGAAMGCESAIIEVLDDGELVVRHQWGLDSDIIGRRTDPESTPHLVKAADSHDPIVVDDIASSPDIDLGTMVESGVRAVLSVPLQVTRTVLGFLSFNWHSGAHDWTEQEIRYARQLATTVSLGLQSAREREQLRASERRFRTVFDSAPVGVAIISPDGRWLRVNDRLCEITGYRREELLEIAYLDITHPDDIPEDRRNREALLRGDADSFTMEKRYLMPDGAVKWCVLSTSLVRTGGEPDYFVSMVEDIDGRKAADEALGRSRRRADLLTRILEDAAQPFAVGRPGGELVMCNDAFIELTGYSATQIGEGEAWDDHITPPEWREVEAPLLGDLLANGKPVRYTKEYQRSDGARVPVEVFAHVFLGRSGPLIYTFITDITDRVAAEEAARLSAALNEIDAHITRSLELDAILNGMVDVASEALGTDTAAVTLLEDQHYVITHASGFTADFVGMRLRREDLPHAELAVSSRGTVVIDDAKNDPRTNHDVIERFGVASVIVVPLLRASEVYGALFFNRTHPGSRFTAAQVDFVTKLGAHVSLAVENSFLYQGEHRIAQTLQDALLRMPDSVPAIEFANVYRSASTASRVGGDFYDLFELDAGHVGIVVGDVSGKGLDAAVLNARLRAGVRAELAVGARTPAQVLARLNDVLVRESSSEVFFTVFLGVLNRYDGRLVYASGGHTTSAVIRPNGALEQLPATGPIVGAFSGLEFHDGYAHLEHGDTVFAYTDGLVEAKGGREMYGETRLFDLLRKVSDSTPQHMVDSVVADVVAFASGLYDDVAVLAVRRR
jgi:PAS domain S-box-containing protein